MINDSEEELRKYVNEQLSKALPEGWSYHVKLQHQYLDVPSDNVTLEHLKWKIIKDDWRDPYLDYRIRFDWSTRRFIIFHSNSTAGVLGFHHFLTTTTSFRIKTDIFDPPELSLVVNYVLSRFEPNNWSPT